RVRDRVTRSTLTSTTASRCSDLRPGDRVPVPVPGHGHRVDRVHTCGRSRSGQTDANANTDVDVGNCPRTADRCGQGRAQVIALHGPEQADLPSAGVAVMPVISYGSTLPSNQTDTITAPVTGGWSQRALRLGTDLQVRVGLGEPEKLPAGTSGEEV